MEELLVRLVEASTTLGNEEPGQQVMRDAIRGLDPVDIPLDEEMLRSNRQRHLSPGTSPHTLTIVDLGGDVCTAYLAPDRDVELTAAVAATNHQGSVEWHEHARATRSVERQRTLERLVVDAESADGFIERFLQPPLFATDRDRRLGTLYTVAYHGGEGRAEFRWPDLVWDQRFGSFEEGTRSVRLREQPAA